MHTHEGVSRIIIQYFYIVYVKYGEQNTEWFSLQYFCSIVHKWMPSIFLCLVQYHTPEHALIQNGMPFGLPANKFLATLWFRQLVFHFSKWFFFPFHIMLAHWAPGAFGNFDILAICCLCARVCVESRCLHTFIHVHSTNFKFNLL